MKAASLPSFDSTTFQQVKQHLHDKNIGCLCQKTPLNDLTAKEAISKVRTLPPAKPSFKKLMSVVVPTEGTEPFETVMLDADIEDMDPRLEGEESETSTQDSPIRQRLSSKLHEVQDQNPQMVSQYVRDIFNYLRISEELYVLEGSYMPSQTEVTDRMRAILFDWLTEVQVQFRLKIETLYLAVSLVDRYLAKEVVKKTRLQLVGVSAMFIASKYEEVYPPELLDFLMVSANTYTGKEVLEMEGSILSKLMFKLTVPSPLCFVQRYAQLINLNKEDIFLSRYFLEMGLLDLNICQIKASLQAAASIYLTLFIGGGRFWNATLEEQLDYTETEVKQCAVKLLYTVKKYSRSKTIHSIRDKYSQKIYHSVAAVIDLEGAILDC